MASVEEVSNFSECLINEIEKCEEVPQKIKTKTIVSGGTNGRELILSAAPHLHKESAIHYNNEVKKEYLRLISLMHR